LLNKLIFKKMKKIYLTLLCVLLAGGIASALDLPIWEEHFTESTDFEKWTVTDASGLPSPKLWDRTNATNPFGNATGDDAWKAAVPNGVNTNTWLVSEGISLTQGVAYTITFQKRLGSTSNAHLSAYIGTNNTFTLNSTDSIWPPKEEAAATGWKSHSVTFTPTSTSTYYLGFHGWTGTSSSNANIAIDGITIGKPATNSITLIPSFPSPYLQIPISQNKVIAKAANTGTAASTNVILSATVNTAQLSPTSGVTVSGTDTTELTIPGVTYLIGDNTVNYTLAATADQYAGDNTATHTFKGTSFVYATDTLPPNFTFSGTDLKSDTQGNIYKIVTETQLK
jgi:hypothetical protein